jgi:hypothetical protein
MSIKNDKIHMVPYPINYDFKNKWITDCVPHLTNPIIQKEIEIGVNDYLSDCGILDHTGPFCRYKPNTRPCNYSQSSEYFDDKIDEEIMQDLMDTGEIPEIVEEEYMDLWRKLELMDENEESSDLYLKICEMRWSLVEPHKTLEITKMNIETYFIHRACHSWNSTFGITLARLCEPNENWEILSGQCHTTVINNQRTKLFDVYGFMQNQNPVEGGREMYLHTKIPITESKYYKPIRQVHIIDMMRNIHKNLPDNKLLNLSFRGGDAEHSQWTFDEEIDLLPMLVAEKNKPIASICHRKENILERCRRLPECCRTFIYKNRWDMNVLLIYHGDDKWSENELVGLCNETLPLNIIGNMYGYV